MLKRVAFSVNTTGAAGSATGAVRVPVPRGIARFCGMTLDYHASAPGTTDVTISTPNGIGATRNLAVNTDAVTDIPFREYVEATSTTILTATGAAVNNPIVMDHITVTVAQSNALTGAVAGFMVFEV